MVTQTTDLKPATPNDVMLTCYFTNYTVMFHEDCPGVFDPCRNVCHLGHELFINENESSRAALIIYGYLYPILVMITLLTTILVVVVLSQRHMRTPTNIVLLYMSLADLCMALVPFGHYFPFVILGNYRHMERLEVWWCWLRYFLSDAIPPFLHYVACWLTVLLAAQRFVYLQWPVTAQKIVTVKRVQAAALAVTLFSFVCSAPYFLTVFHFDIVKFRILDYHFAGIELVFSNCLFLYSPLVNIIGVNQYFSIFYWCRAILFVLLPSLLLVSFSALLVKGIKRANQRKERLLRQNRQSEARRQNESNSTSTMLVVIVVIFLLVNLPQGVILGLFCLQETTQSFVLSPNKVWTVMQVDNLLILATFPINFAIYCSMSTQFRLTFKRLFFHLTPGSVRPPRRVSEPTDCRRSSSQTMATYGILSNNGTNGNLDVEWNTVVNITPLPSPYLSAPHPFAERRDAKQRLLR